MVASADIGQRCESTKVLYNLDSIDNNTDESEVEECSGVHVINSLVTTGEKFESELTTSAIDHPLNFQTSS